jgi:hypothetical protein
MPFADLTEAELELIQQRRRDGVEPATAGQPMPYDESKRPWGEAPPPNPPTVQRLPTAEQWVTKQLRNLQAVGEQNYREGITHPKKDPIQAGIAAQPAYEAKMRDPAVLKRREAGLRRTNSDEWASMAERVGAGRLVAGVVERQYKVERAVGSLVGKLATHLQRIDALPNVTDADRERRMVENLKGLRAMKGTI